jgi:hypothetical protein
VRVCRAAKDSRLSVCWWCVGVCVCCVLAEESSVTDGKCLLECVLVCVGVCGQQRAV